MGTCALRADFGSVLASTFMCSLDFPKQNECASSSRSCKYSLGSLLNGNVMQII